MFQQCWIPYFSSCFRGHKKYRYLRLLNHLFWSKWTTGKKCPLLPQGIKAWRHVFDCCKIIQHTSSIWHQKLRIIIVREYNITEFIQCYSETCLWGLFHRLVIDSLTWSLYTLWGRLFFFENKMSLNQFSWKRKWKILC